jgi:hypothetical protein
MEMSVTHAWIYRRCDDSCQELGLTRPVHNVDMQSKMRRSPRRPFACSNSFRPARSISKSVQTQAYQVDEYYHQESCVRNRRFLDMFDWKAENRITTRSHSHIWHRDKIKADQIDNASSAVLPDLQRDPRLYEIIVMNMVHGPCMKGGECTKRYPRWLLHDTHTSDDEYPLYRRRG